MHPRRRPWQRALSPHTARGSGAGWRKLRAQVLEEEPVCRLCGQRPSTVVDHVVPKHRGGTDERGNLRGICGPCDRVLSSRQGAEARRRARG